MANGLFQGDGLFKAPYGLGQRAAVAVDRPDVVEGSGLAGPVAHLAPDRQRLLVVSQRLGQRAAVAVDRPDVGEGSGLAGPVAHLAPDRERLLVVSQRLGQPTEIPMHHSTAVESTRLIFAFAGA